jgi:hypothetical protein
VRSLCNNQRAAVSSSIDDGDAFDVAAMQHLAERLSCSWLMSIVRCSLQENCRPVTDAFSNTAVSYIGILTDKHGLSNVVPGMRFASEMISDWLVLGCKATKRAPYPIDIGQILPTLVLPEGSAKVRTIGRNVLCRCPGNDAVEDVAWAVETSLKY